jgi:spermidine/putrescine transport system permease protein
MRSLWRSISQLFLPIWVGLTYLFLYVPLVVLMVFSFNKVMFPYRWVGFSWHWYQELFASSEIWSAAINSFIVGLSAVTLSLVLGLLFVVWASKNKLTALMGIFYPNLVVPEIVVAVGLLSFFIFFNVPLGLTSLIVGHTLLGLGYAIPIIYGRFQTLDQRIVEASLSLGATHSETFFKIVLPLLRPALVAAGLLIFIISLDDFLIAFFCAGSSAQTLSLYIFSMIRSGVSPVVNALATFMLVISSLLVMIFCSLKTKDNLW